MSNLPDIEFLTGFIGQEETQRLEFKSSLPLRNETIQKREKFISESVVPTVSAFLNTDGGRLIIGIEEKDGTAVELSEGVPRRLVKWEQLQSSICSRIQPAVAGHVSVSSVKVGENSSNEKVFAFIVDVKPGITAYQADDKKYYGRRAGQSEALEDKDIRLRMLSADKPRISATLVPRSVHREQEFAHHIGRVEWVLSFQNVGVRNVPKAIIRWELCSEGLTEEDRNLILLSNPKHRKIDFEMSDVDHNGLLPGLDFEYPLISLTSLNFVRCIDVRNLALTADVTIFVDDGQPFEITNYDLMSYLRPIIDANWVDSNSNESHAKL